MPTFLPTRKQIEAHHLLEKNKVVLYGGAIRGAKSYWGCMEIISLCFKYPNSRWLVLRKSLTVIKSTLLKTFRENFLDKGWSQYVKSFPETTFVLTWNNGSQIIFMSENYEDDKELNRFKGLEINGAFIDECNEIQEVTYDKVIERSGSWFHSPGCPIKILLTCNPAQNWVKERFYDKWKKGTLPPGHAYLQARIYDNPHIPPDYLESLNSLPKYQYNVFVEGNWEVSLKVGGEFYKCFELDQHVSPAADGHLPPATYKPELPLHISFDDNSTPYLPCGIFQIVMHKDSAGKVTGKDVLIIDEIAGITPRNKIKDVCAEFIRKYPAHASGLFIYGDATADKEDTKTEKGYNFFRLAMDALKQYKPQLRVLSSNPSVVMRGMWINTVMEKEIGGIRVIINNECKRTINDLIQLKEAADGTKHKEMETNAAGVRYQRVGHFSDLLDYIMCSAFASEFTQYQKGDVITSITFGRNSKSKNSY